MASLWGTGLGGDGRREQLADALERTGRDAEVGERAALLAFDSHGVNQSRWVNRTGDASCRRAVLSKMWQPQRGHPCALTGVPDLGIGHTWNTIATESLLDADFYLI